jgi:hypothetical protein
MFFLWLVGIMFLVLLVVVLVVLLRDNPVKNKNENFVGVADPTSSIVHEKMSFQMVPPVYVSTMSNVLVPSRTCCDTLFSVVPSNLPDGSFFISTDKQQYLDTVFIDLKGPASFFSIQLVPFQKMKKGWMVETVNDHKRFYQLVDNQGKIYLGLALDQKTIQGFDVSKGIYASIDVILVA